MSEDRSEEVPIEMPENMSGKNVRRYAGKNVRRYVTKECWKICQGIGKKEMSKEISRDMSEDMSEDLSERMLEEMSERRFQAHGAQAPGD